ncbi:MAG: hypothetical protein ND895_16585 [Pyrinomonadaceae bacterium]|nr:hypothetical protein [Pyrinomonadaceae bacterium]
MSAVRLGFAQGALLIAVFLGFALAMPSAAQTQQPGPTKQSGQTDPLKPLQLFIGKWEGDSQGQPGVGKMEREYSLVLKNRFIQVSNKALYPPQEKNPKGEVHEDLGFFGYDRALKKLSFRQFHVEGFVVQYSLDSESEDGRTLVFKSTTIENISSGWVARETYRFLSNDEFVETFALAGPGKEFETYSETRFRRVK